MNKQFTIKVTLPFPVTGEGMATLFWLHRQYNPKGKKSVTKKQQEAAVKLLAPRDFEFVFEATEEGEWIFVGRKA
jgi:hypothetical protein